MLSSCGAFERRDGDFSYFNFRSEDIDFGEGRKNGSYNRDKRRK
ncbi:MAG: hypothetical protein ACTS6G_04835 [Candidatus Hodgkinia cicadicola]